MKHRDWVREGRMKQRGFTKVILHDRVLSLIGAIGERDARVRGSWDMVKRTRMQRMDGKG